MNRREFTKLLGMGVFTLGMGTPALALADKSPQIAFTIDDVNCFDTPLMTGEAQNQALVTTLRKYSVKAALFVCGKYVDNETGQRYMGAWDQENHLIANHSYSHLYYNSAKVSFESFSQDLLHGETIVKGFSNFRKFFRFPYLKEGNTADKRDQMRTFLQDQGYRNGHVTIDASDWYVDGRLRERLAKDPKANVTPYRDFYLRHIWDRATYYDGLAKKVLGKSVKHTLLLHNNLLNALFLGDLLKMFQEKGWKLINAADAFTDPVFSSAPKIVPAGESLIWALAKESGKFEKLLRYPGEDGDYEKGSMDKLNL